MIRLDFYGDGNLSGMSFKGKIPGDQKDAGKTAGTAGKLQNPPFYASKSIFLSSDA